MEDRILNRNSLLGVIDAVGDVQMHESQMGGLPFVTRKIKMTTQEEYAQSAYLTIRGDLALNFGYKEGDKVQAWYNLKAFTTQNGGCGNCLNCWQMRRVEGLEIRE